VASNQLPMALSSICDKENLGLVNNLAIEIENSFLRHHENRRLHEWIADVLDIFPNVKRLTLILGNWPETTNKYQVRTIDEIPFGDFSVWNYWEFKYANQDEGLPFIPVKWFKVDMEGLEQERLASTKHGPRSWEIPPIQYKLEMTPRVKAWIELANRGMGQRSRAPGNRGFYSQRR